ncbi:hypothetical protein L3N51_02131 [Metallosphaera sp. J1]|uniref:hypothetical protein n=1 Tax=Metallosphaera TaxID=41980 RepID=UPI001EDF1235|nr:hypothetical protein [Metallosphaera javensis (ex Hofmann et al. 2022)]MCG3109835.1 hypothetical protein [Metallosphaera javensis (ex Hofmann et al. 2022)]BCS92408.1 MAG: uncharacterized integral membrane protein SSO2561 [Metallosphaera javensis (ex Sakai et al. 2022)]
MKSLKYSIPVALAVWWIPILNGIIVGLVAGFSERRRDTAVISAGIGSLIASALYLYLAFKVLVVPILGNLLPVLSVIFSIVGISLSLLSSYLVSNRTTISVVTPEGAEMEFYARNNDEIEQRLSSLTQGCGNPSYNVIDENNMIVTRKCNGYELQYQVRKEGRGYRVNIKVKTNFDK